MKKPRVVLADNDRDYLNPLKEILEKSGLEVLTASTLQEAREALKAPDIDLAILDLRFERNRDDKDISGLSLANEEQFSSIPKILITAYQLDKDVIDALREKQSASVVEFILKAIGEEGVLAAITRVLTTATENQVKKRSLPNSSPAEKRRIFVVHGHDDMAKVELSFFLYKLDLIPIILNETPTGGRTVIEQIERHSEVDFAIVLLTPDDIGYSKKEPFLQLERARQNVIFEMGFFIGRLSREKVRALYKEKVEILSDFQGVLYIPMDSNGSWRPKLARELEGAGFKIDYSKVA